MQSRANQPGWPPWRSALPVIVAAIAVVVLVVLLWYLVDVVLLCFAAVLLALLMRAPADWIAARWHWPPRLALALVVVAVVGVLAAGAWLFGRTLVGQLSELAQRVPDLVAQVRERVSGYEAVWKFLEPKQLMGRLSFVGRGVDVLTSSFGIVANLVVVAFVGFFVALDPGLYKRGVLHLVPVSRRGRAAQVLEEVGHTLRRWLVGQLILMAVIFGLTAVGLWLLDVQMALGLAAVAGLLEFVPYLGPILSAVPALLVALSQDTQLAIYVLLLFVAIQAIEGNVLQPIVQQRTVWLAPALVLVAQVVFGILIGLLGVMLATPVAAALMVVVQKLYIEDLLGEASGRRGEGACVESQSGI
jgi:predicted PurR-regulated permease PerM